MAKHKNKLWAVVIGDIVGSRKTDQAHWLPVLEEAIRGYAVKYDIFRGDSFQLQLPLAEVFECVFYIKACLRAINLDVRIGIGIGEIGRDEETIKQSSGEAFVLSGMAFDGLEKETFSIRSKEEAFDLPINLMLQLAAEIASRWTNDMAAAVAVALKNPSSNQKDLAKLLQKKHQSQISTTLTKAAYAKIRRVIQYATNEVLKK